MASPQVENGHIDIANEIAEALCFINLSPRESRVLWALWRKTYGWHKKADRISYSQFEKATGLNRWDISKTLKKLEHRGLITIHTNRQHSTYAFQKDYTTWTSPNTLAITPTVTYEPLGQTPMVTHEPLALQQKPLGQTPTVTIGSNTNDKRKYKRKTKEKNLTFQQYLSELRPKYPSLDVEAEWEKCKLWWEESGKQMKRPKLAMLNWLNKAVKFAEQDGPAGQKARTTADYEREEQDVGAK